MKLCPTCKRTFIDSQQACPLDHAPLAPCAGEPPVGLGRELGKYRLIGVLGEGGMGTIYIAAHAQLNRCVAIKVLRPELANRKELVQRFFDEARALNALQHPNIVESIDMVEDAFDGAYAVLELLSGPDLKTRLAAGRLPMASVLRIGAQLADALSAAHARGIVHRDLKPENLILVTRDGHDDVVKLIDFGVAQISDERATGKPYGTPAYMAPEQAAGQRVDGRADLYALGVLLFEMAVGRHPFPATSDQHYILRHAEDEPVRPSLLAPGCPRALDVVILRCLEKRAADRYATAAAVATALRAIDPHARPKTSWGRWIVGGLSMAAIAAGAAILVPRYFMTSTAASAPPVDRPHDPPPAVATVTATPPSPTPTPTPPPIPDEPVAATVAIEIISVPDGATVYRAGETIALGVTPFTTTLLRSDKRTQLRFERAGYEPHLTDIKVDESHEITVKLIPAPATATAPPPPLPPHKVKSVEREGVIDPFAH